MEKVSKDYLPQIINTTVLCAQMQLFPGMDYEVFVALPVVTVVNLKERPG